MLLVGASAVWWIGTVLVVPAPAAAAGLYYLAHRIAHEERIEFGFFWQQAKQQFGRSWLLAAINIATLGLLLVNIVFYSQLTNFLRYATFAWMYLLLMWLGMQLYLFPMLFEMEQPRLLHVLRNALFLLLARPGYTLLLLVLLFLATLLSVALPFLLIGVWPALIAITGARATASTIEQITQRQADSSDSEP